MTFVFQSRVMAELLDTARRYARSSATTLITGESGTGKELLGSFVHQHSRRAGKPYVRVNCAALSEGLVESELFGHQAGAFTGAVAGRMGRIEAARGGTLLLDEVSEVPLRMQAKLLRVLEEGEYERVGSNDTLVVEARLLATSNRSLSRAVARRRFRADLYHRLNVLRLHVPALRERRDDIPILVHHFLKRFQEEEGTQVRGVSPQAMHRLCEYDWPGNVRELRNLMHRLCVLGTSQKIEPSDLSELDEAPRHEAPALPEPFRKMRLDEIERHVILLRLQQFRGNKTAAAEQLGVTPRTLRNKMCEYRRLGFV
jgi:DNA-binding NtrC family response regulator